MAAPEILILLAKVRFLLPLPNRRRDKRSGTIRNRRYDSTESCADISWFGFMWCYRSIADDVRREYMISFNAGIHITKQIKEEIDKIPLELLDNFIKKSPIVTLSETIGNGGRSIESGPDVRGALIEAMKNYIKSDD